MPETGFIKNVNTVANKIAVIESANEIFDEGVVTVLQEIALLDLDEAILDLKKGNYLGNRKLDINLALNMIGVTEDLLINDPDAAEAIWVDTAKAVHYSGATITFNDGVVISLPFLFDNSPTTISTHGDLITQLSRYDLINAVRQVATVSNVVAIDSTTYTVTINGTVLTYISDVSATVAEIITGLVNTINLSPVPVTAAEAGTSFTLSADVVGTAFTATVNGNMTLTATVPNGESIIAETAFLAKMGDTILASFATNVVGEIIRAYDVVGHNSNLERIQLHAVSGQFIDPNPIYYWAKTTSAFQTLSMRAGDIIKLGNDIDSIITLASRITEMIDLQNKMPQLVTNGDSLYTNIAKLVTIYEEITGLVAIYDDIKVGGTNYINTTAIDLNRVDSKIATVAADLQLGNLSKIKIVKESIASVNTVAASIANVNIVATDIGNVNIVAPSIANVNATGGSIANVNTVATSIANVNIVAPSIASVNTVAPSIVGVNTVSTSIANVNTVASSIAKVDTVSASIANVNIVGPDIAKVNTVSAAIANVNTTATNIASVNTTAANVASVVTVATNIASVNTNTANIIAIQNASANAATATTQAGISTTQAGISTTQAEISTAQAGIATTQASNAASSASTATTQAGIATAQATVSTTQAGIATTQAGIATTKANSILGLTTQATTGAAGSLASVSYNSTDGKMTFSIPQGIQGIRGDAFTVNSVGLAADRALYDAQIKGFSFLAIDVGLVYFKLSNTSANWSIGAPFGKGDQGDIGLTGVGITSIAFLSTTDGGGLAGAEGATDTYRITNSDATTYDFVVHNGIDGPLIDDVTLSLITTWSNQKISDELDLKADVNSPTFTGTVGGITAAMVGLGNVNNTSNATERAATATLTNKTLTTPVINSPTGITKDDVGLSNVNNTSDLAKPVSTATQTALNLKAPLASPTFTGTVLGITAAMVGAQPLDADLTSIAALAGTAGLLKKTAANTWSLDTTAYTTNMGTVTGVTGTAPVSSSGGTAPVISMAAATSVANGYMTSAYASKLDGIATGATANTGDVTLAGTQTLTNKTINIANNTLTGVQPTLVSGTSIKTVNGTSLLGAGDVAVGDVTLSGTQTLTNKTLVNPILTLGITTVTMTNANVTLTALQYGNPVIVITGTLTTNLNLIFPNIVNEWTVINNTTGTFTITCKTAAGTGVVVNTAAMIVSDGTNIQSAITDAAAIIGGTVSTATGGTANNITATFAPVPRYPYNGVPFFVRAASANTSTTPTFTPNGGVIAAATIVKGNNLPLAVGDIAGAGHWLLLQYDGTLTKWVLLNPATGVVSLTGASIQGQTYTAFTTAGAAPNFTLTPLPAPAALTANLRFRVKFHAAGAGANQLNVSALGNKALKQYDSTGAKVTAVVAANQLVDVEYDGTDMVVLDPLPAASVQIQPISASVAASALTISASALSLSFRSTTLGSGAVTDVAGTPTNLVVPSTATLGTVDAVQSRLAVLALNNAGTIELAVVNIAGGNDLTETGVVTTTTISATADLSNVIYSTTGRTGVAYRVIGYIESTQATAGTWATAPSTIQGYGGQALAALSSLGYGQTWQNVTGSRASGTTYYNTTGKPIFVSIALTLSATSHIILTVNGVALIGAASPLIAEPNTIFEIIPVGASYSAVNSAGTSVVLNWSELR